MACREGFLRYRILYRTTAFMSEGLVVQPAAAVCTATVSAATASKKTDRRFMTSPCGCCCGSVY
jgi:hypothetical protein